MFNSQTMFIFTGITISDSREIQDIQNATFMPKNQFHKVKQPHLIALKR